MLNFLNHLENPDVLWTDERKPYIRVLPVVLPRLEVNLDGVSDKTDEVLLRRDSPPKFLMRYTTFAWRYLPSTPVARIDHHEEYIACSERLPALLI